MTLQKWHTEGRLGLHNEDLMRSGEAGRRIGRPNEALSAVGFAIEKPSIGFPPLSLATTTVMHGKIRSGTKRYSKVRKHTVERKKENRKGRIRHRNVKVGLGTVP